MRGRSISLIKNSASHVGVCQCKINKHKSLTPLHIGGAGVVAAKTCHWSFPVKTEIKNNKVPRVEQQW